MVMDREVDREHRMGLKDQDQDRVKGRVKDKGQERDRQVQGEVLSTSDYTFMVGRSGEELRGYACTQVFIDYQFMHFVAAHLIFRILHELSACDEIA
jgi:hypothetical protein